MGDLDYCLLMKKQCNLTTADMFQLKTKKRYKNGQKNNHPNA